ncbi:FAD-dependent oxidoreductase [Rhodopirellula bahusiensis]|uniref:Monooxygenase n=1 Tax=Rhodopirellula bahusiensis TaxID=2014065 RepID=A0A2G1W9P9_9BACT|nr:NAD(P)/FAD-dependent oxidoreductase [Rhodopirellula bahusiensis]PHQ35753.1 monooxygenase [Rhodopirellula bahusiensis]
MRIAVSGCGIAGTAVGHLLALAGHEVTIFEQAEQCQAIGAGIMLQPSGQIVLDRLGILDSIARQSAKLEGIEAFLLSGRPLVELNYAALGDQHFAYGVHRGLLFTHLMKLCKASDVRIQTSTQICDFCERENEVHVIDQHGTQHGPFDFLVAADGSRSRLRAAAKLSSRTVNYEYAAIWATGPCSLVTNRLHQVIDRTNRLVGLLPIGDGQCSFFWGLRADQYSGLVQRGLPNWKREVIEMCAPAAELLASIDNFQAMTFAGYRHVGMKRWHANKIVFLGDAAHPSSPHLGQGVNLALEDAACFADAINDTDNFDQAAVRYQKIRQRKVRYYQSLTRMLTPFFQSDIPMSATCRNVGLPWFPRVPWVRRRMLQTLSGLQNGWF